MPSNRMRCCLHTVGNHLLLSFEIIFVSFFEIDEIFSRMSTRVKEYVSLAGLRHDGRKVSEFRSVTPSLAVLEASDGSCSYQIGNTRVVAAVYGPKASERAPDVGSVVLDDVAGLQVYCHVVFAAFSGHRHRVMEGDRRSANLVDLVVGTVRSAVFATTYPNSQIDIHVQVLQDEGGVDAAVINAVSLALLDAHIPMKDVVVAAHVAVLNEHVLVDPTRVESNGSGAEMLYVTYGRAVDEVVTCRVDKRVKGDEMMRMMNAAADACQVFFFMVESPLRDHVRVKVEATQQQQLLQQVE
eukprot:PhM_4_TR7067/c0_g2_i1/m.35620/K11600/RRP41, EXOSC4, SKI6; exosome complex component RRP41